MPDIMVANPHRGLSHGLYLLDTLGVERPSRNGPVRMAPFPVTTEYRYPEQRVIFWPQRDANPFFHLYESLWMLSARNDLASLTRYAKQMATYSDDGKTVRGSAYGYRWRKMFGFDQLRLVVDALKKNPEDRRQVLQMWSADIDLGRVSKDLPCNLTATVQINHRGELELCVFCRSNDIIWGTYGANAVHFSMLQEYLARAIGVPVGPYRQISINYHAYVDKLESVKDLPRQSFSDPYLSGDVHHVPMPSVSMAALDSKILHLVDYANSTFEWQAVAADDPWALMVFHVLAAHELYRKTAAPERYTGAIKMLELHADQQADWIVAAREWMQRRLDKWTREQI